MQTQEIPTLKIAEGKATFTGIAEMGTDPVALIFADGELSFVPEKDVKVFTLRLLMDQADPESLRADSVAGALEQASLLADFEQPLEKRIESYQAAREALRPALQAVNGTTAPVFYAIGNAHLDLAWLWPMAETHRKTCRTFAQQLCLSVISR